eukprot:gene52340-70003_t
MDKAILRFLGCLSVLALSLLTGCASVRLIDSNVVSVAAFPPGLSLQDAKYRFERLPSQANNPNAGLAEVQAQAAMTAVGLVRDDASAQYSVLVGFSGTQYWVDRWVDRSAAHSAALMAARWERRLAAPWAVRMAALSVDCWAGRSELRWVAPMADRWVDGWAGCSADRSAAPWE